MSLQVWLPLIEDLRNQGLISTTITNNGVTYSSTGGKLGGCYYFGGTGYFSGDSLSANMKTATFWVKLSNLNNAVVFADYKSRLAFGIYSTYLVCSCVDSSGPRTCYNKTLLTVDEWTHIAVVKTSSAYLLYINGVLQTPNSTLDYWSANMSDKFTLGARSNGSTCMTGYINDFRLYDNILSEEEVKEISKGLVLHYTLGNKAIESTTNLFHPLIETSRNTSPAWDKTLNGNYMIHCDGFGDGYNGGVSNPTTGYHGHWIYDENNNLMGILPNLNSVIGQTNRWLGLTASVSSTSIGAGNSYTISWEQKTDNLNCYVNAGYYYKKNSSESGYGSFHDGTKNCKNTIVNTWQPMEISFTLSQDWDGTYTGGTVYFYGHYGSEGTTHIRNLQFEAKNHATAFVNGLTTRTSNTIYDCSGFCNNGNIFGTLTISNDTQKYNVSTYFTDGNTDYITSSIFMPTDQITISTWVKGDGSTAGANSYHIPLCIGSGYSEFSVDSSKLYRQGFYVNGVRYCDTISGAIVNNGSWHLMTATYNGTTICRYLDGILINSRDVTGTLNGGILTLLIGKYFSGGYNSKKFQQSDVRIYATALSAEDVLALYENRL